MPRCDTSRLRLESARFAHYARILKRIISRQLSPSIFRFQCDVIARYRRVLEFVFMAAQSSSGLS